jgi:hypothetical protein
LTERFGPLRFTFDLPSNREGLRMVLRGWSAFRVPLPSFAAPRIEAAEWEEDNWFRFKVAVALPFVGPVIGYSGRLREPAFAKRATRHDATGQGRRRWAGPIRRLAPSRSA